jgi:hypothetical protein
MQKLYVFEKGGTFSYNVWGHAITQTVIRWFPPWQRGFSVRSGDVEFVADKVALG